MWGGAARIALLALWSFEPECAHTPYEDPPYTFTPLKPRRVSYFASFHLHQFT